MTSKHTILYAEDDVDDLLMVREAFERHDHIEVLHAINGWEALSILRTLQGNHILPCLIILDINMPVMDGKEALVKIKMDDKLKEIPVVLFSTSNSFADQAFAQNWGIDLITKPLHYDDLEAIAKQFVDRCNFEMNKLKEAS